VHSLNFEPLLKLLIELVQVCNICLGKSEKVGAYRCPPVWDDTQKCD